MHNQNKIPKQGQDNNAPPTQMNELTSAYYCDTDGIYKYPLTDKPINPQPYTSEWWQSRSTKAERITSIRQNICPACEAELFKIRGGYAEDWDEVAVSCASCDYSALLLVKFP